MQQMDLFTRMEQDGSGTQRGGPFSYLKRYCKASKGSLSKDSSSLINWEEGEGSDNVLGSFSTKIVPVL